MEGWSIWISPLCPYRLLFLCNQRRGIGQSHILQSPLSDLGPSKLSSDMRHEVFHCQGFLKQRWHRCFLLWAGAFQRPRLFSTRGPGGGGGGRARHTWSSWFDINYFCAPMTAGKGGVCPALHWLALEPWPKSKHWGQNKRFTELVI